MEIRELEKKAKEIRRETIKSLYTAQSGHPGSSLSTADILTALYFKPLLKYKAGKPEWEGRDFFLLSNGHAVPALYAVLACAGFYPVEKLDGLRKIGTPLHGHPKRKTFPGIEFSSGSLGMGLSAGIGRAIGLKLLGKKNKVYVMMSDGEQEEGSTWEAVMFATKPFLAGLKGRLDNLVAVIDDNQSQINGPSRQVMPSLFPLAEKYKAFDWQVLEIDGHNMKEIVRAFSQAREAEKPAVIIAKTKIGRGVSFMEGDYGWHHGKLTKEQYEAALNDLGLDREC